MTYLLFVLACGHKRAAANVPGGKRVFDALLN
jgi:hypothetical protein